MRLRGLIFFLFFLAAALLWAGEPVRRVQEELRKRNLYFGDVNGQLSPELRGALRAYQTRKGFVASGEIDDMTLRSLQVITSEEARFAKEVSWPDVPVLKSDAARVMSPDELAALAGDAAPDLEPSPTPSVPERAPAETFDPQQVEALVKNYLRDGEKDDVEKQIRYFDFPLDYFDHGLVGQKFVALDTQRYLRRWAQRKYQLLAPVKVGAGAKADEAMVEFPLHFSVQSKGRHAEGKTRNLWTIKVEGAELRIVAIKEEHLRE